MHNTIEYKQTDEIAKYNQAIEDTIGYLGKEKFDDIVSEFRKVPEITLEQASFYLSIAGIQGYPVKAFYNYCFPL